MLLGNGNKTDAGDVAGTVRHYAVWEDPWPKPCYLFAIVAGDLVVRRGPRYARRGALHAPPCPNCALTALPCAASGAAQALEDTFVTQSGRSVALRIFTQAHNADKTEFAMRSLKAAMKWDEERYGLEYDLDLFNIVAVDDFNMVREQRALVALCCLASVSC